MNDIIFGKHVNIRIKGGNWFSGMVDYEEDGCHFVLYNDAAIKKKIDGNATLYKDMKDYKYWNYEYSHNMETREIENIAKEVNAMNLRLQDIHGKYAMIRYKNDDEFLVKFIVVDKKIFFLSNNESWTESWDDVTEDQDEFKYCYTPVMDINGDGTIGTRSWTVQLTKTTTEKETNTMEIKDIKLESDLTKTLTQNIAIKNAMATIETIEGSLKANLDTKATQEEVIAKAQDVIKEVNKQNKELEKEYQVQAKIVKTNTK